MTIGPGDGFTWRNLPPEFEWSALRLQVQKLEQPALLQVTLHEEAGTATVLGIVADEPLGVFLAQRREGAPAAILSRALVPQALKTSATPFALQIAREGSAGTVAVNGAQVLTFTDDQFGRAVPTLSTQAGSYAVLSVAVAGTVPAGSAGKGKSTTWQDNLVTLRAETPWLAYLAAAGLAAAALLLGGLALRALCLGRPSLREVVDATSIWAAVTALPFIAAAVVKVPDANVIAAAVAAVGLSPALHSLRTHIWTPTPGTRADRAAQLVGAVLVVAIGTAALVRHHDSEAASTEASPRSAATTAAETAAAGDTADVSVAGPTALDAGSALVIAGDRRDVEVSVVATLGPSSVLEMRLRADSPPHARGLALWVPSDARLRASFVRESAEEFAPSGSSADAVAPGRPLQISARIRGSRCEAEIDGKTIATTDTSDSQGNILLLAARGSVAVSDLRVAALPGATAAAGPAPGWLSIAGIVAAFLVIVVVALSWLGSFPWAQAALLAACAFVPLAAVLSVIGKADAGTIAIGARAAWLAALVLLVPLLVHARRLMGVRLMLLGLLACLVAPLAALGVACTRATNLLPAASNYVAWSGDRLESDLVYLEHPVVRLLNDYLAGHRFRGKEVSLAKPENVKRVLTLGGSSTWGYGLPESEQKEYPAVLERLLNDPAAGPADRVEVLNAACQGGTGARQFRFLRDGLLAFEPDVVTVSLTYNDAFALTRVDEDACFDAIGEPDYERTLAGTIRSVWDVSRGEAEMKRLVARYRQWTGSTAELWASLGHGEQDSPPARFEAILRRFAQLARDRHFRLVFIKEPLAGDWRCIWKEELGAAMDRVGTDYGIPVVDPTPALQAAGGEPLFMDEVHLRPAGHEVVAQTLMPVVRAALRP